MKKFMAIIVFVLLSAPAFSQVITAPNDYIYGEYSLTCEGSPYRTLYLSIDGTAYLFQSRSSAPAKYIYYFIENLMYIGNVAYYFRFYRNEESTWILSLIPAFGESAISEIVCKKVE